MMGFRSDTSYLDQRDIKGFRVLEEVCGPAALQRSAVVCRTDQPYPLTEQGRITALPLGGTRGVGRWIADHITDPIGG